MRSKIRFKVISIATTFLLLSLFLQLNYVASASQSDGPIWLKEGTYAKYAIDPSRVGFLNNTFIFAKTGTDVTYTWRCVDLNDTIAKLEVSIECETVNATVNLSAII